MPGFFGECGFLIDDADEMGTIDEMTTPRANPGLTAPDVFADGEAVVEALVTGKPLDPEIARRIQERAARITEEIRQQHGVLDIAVPAIRELRDGVDSHPAPVDPEDVRALAELSRIMPTREQLKSLAATSAPPPELLDVDEERPW
jgi:hypothetical protein